MYKNPDFDAIAFNKKNKPSDVAAWKQQLEKETGKSFEELYWRSM